MKQVKKEDVLTPEESKMLLHGCKTVRDRALVSLLLDTGVRAGELANIQIKDVHLSGDDPFIELTHSKTETGLRDVYLVDSLHEIRAWMQLHPNKNKPDAFFFMPLRARGGEKPTPFMTVPSIHAVVVAAGKKAGLEKKVWTHLLRHVAATNVAVEGMSASMMNAAFGWSDGGRMAGRYGHVSARDAAHFRKKAKGIEVKGTEKQAARICWRCNTTNAWHADFCAKCSSALDKEQAKEDKLSAAQKMEKVMERLARLEGKRGKDSSKNAKARAKEKLRAMAATRKAKKG
jgi:ribosomal protein L40E